MNDDVAKFIEKWAQTGASERANFQPFCDDLCDLIGVPRPDGQKPEEAENAYVFEKSVPLHQPDGSQTTGRIDLYKRGHFVMEGKQGSDEGAKGHIRWLRPEYQRPEDRDQKTGKQTELETSPTRSGTATAVSTKQPWPKTVAEQVAAVRNIIQQTGWTSEQDIKVLAQHFKGVRSPKVQAIADALIALGQAA